jgi:hypothetical protein
MARSWYESPVLTLVDGLEGGNRHGPQACRLTEQDQEVAGRYGRGCCIRDNRIALWIFVSLKRQGATDP